MPRACALRLALAWIERNRSAPSRLAIAVRSWSGMKTSVSRVSTTSTPGCFSQQLLSRSATSSTSSASLTPLPCAPGSWPPCPASMTMRETPARAGAPARTCRSSCADGTRRRAASAGAGRVRGDGSGFRLRHRAPVAAGSLRLRPAACGHGRAAGSEVPIGDGRQRAAVAGVGAALADRVGDASPRRAGARNRSPAGTGCRAEDAVARRRRRMSSTTRVVFFGWRPSRTSRTTSSSNFSVASSSAGAAACPSDRRRRGADSRAAPARKATSRVELDRDPDAVRQAPCA